jgi:DNA modification methylase
MGLDLFGEEIIKDELLRDKFIEPPFSVLDTKSGNWQRRKRLWASKGIKGEVGRDATAIVGGTDIYRKISSKEGYDNRDNYVSIFDPALCEVLYHWFCPVGGKVLDPFAGGSVRGIVANYLGYKYYGVDIRKEQIDSNIEQGLSILPIDNQPQWYVGDSREFLHIGDNRYDTFYNQEDTIDFVFFCPPYANLEVYSTLDGDISNMDYKNFLEAYELIIDNSCTLLKTGGYACFVVGEVRGSDGNYLGLIPDTINAFKKAGMKYYNEAILLNPIASGSMRANGNMKTEKLVKVHQNILIFKKQ